MILDAPPGTACPVIESVKGSDFCLLVTEPTPFGLNDLELAVGMLEKLGIPKGVVVNKADIGDRGVWDYCTIEKYSYSHGNPDGSKNSRVLFKGYPHGCREPILYPSISKSY